MVSLFCRHNRFTADCPICSRGTVLDAATRERRPASGRSTPAPRGARAPGSAPARAAAGGGAYRGPYAAAGPYERDGARREVRLERVPGGLRLADWTAGTIARSAPVLPATDLARLVEEAGAKGVVREREHEALRAALGATAQAPAGDGADTAYGASRGRSGDLQDELRVERLDGPDLLRVGRWTLRPGQGWMLNEAPTMFPVARYAEALREAARRGLLAG